MLRTFIRNIVLLGNAVFIVLLLISYLSWYVDPGVYWLVALIGFAYPYFLLVNIGFVIFWLIRKRWFFLLSVFAIGLGWNMAMSIFSFNKQKQIPQNHLSILSYNVQQFNAINTYSSTEVTKNILNFTDSINASVVCLQEFSQRNASRQQDYLNKKLSDYPYYSSGLPGKDNINNNSIVTYSKYRIQASNSVTFKGSANGFIYTDLIINNRVIRIYNCHLQSNRIDPHDIEMLDDFKIKYSEEELRGVRKIAGKLKRAYTYRVTQIDSLCAHAKNCPYPFILVGDFNDPPFSYTYHKLRQTAKDAFTNSGKGIGNTYQRKIRGFRIDYVFYSSGFEGKYFTTFRKKYSDHFPVKAILEINL